MKIEYDDHCTHFTLINPNTTRKKTIKEENDDLIKHYHRGIKWEIR